ncbi:MAG: hypothetical protein AAF902_22360 [Chloroflexota bacterium]
MKNIPYWVLGIAVLMALAALALTIMGYMDPSTGPGVLPGDSPSLAGTYGLFLSRNLATAVIMIIAIAMRSPGMMLNAFFMRVFSDVFDIVNTLAGGGPFPVSFLALIIIALPAIWYLWPMVEKTSYGSNAS